MKDRLSTIKGVVSIVLCGVGLIFSTLPLNLFQFLGEGILCRPCQDFDGTIAPDARFIMETVRTNKTQRLPLCHRTQLQQGQWIQEILPRPPYETNFRKCPSSTVTINNASRRVFLDYQWQPNDYQKCDFGRWNATLFCQLTQNAPILIVGDSLSFEMYLALVEPFVKSSSNVQFQSLNKPVVQAICDGSTYVAFKRTDDLNRVHETVDIDFFPTILILNRGAHYVPDEQLLKELNVTFHHVKEWLQRCRQVHGIKCHFYWRTTVPGHVGCKDFTEPVNNLTMMEEWVASHRAPKQTKQGLVDTHWYDFRHQNVLVSQLLESTFRQDQVPMQQQLISYRILDAYYLNILRPDRHVLIKEDCLHSCAPGKASVYNRLLLHWLRMDRTEQDIQQITGYTKINPTWMNRSVTKFF